MPVRLLRALAALALVAAALACAAPTLPLPPPSLPGVEQSTEPNRYRLRAVRGAEPGAIVVLVNRNPTVPGPERAAATVADDEGTWEVEVWANPGDTLDITQEFGSTRSPPVVLTLPR